MGPVGDDDGAAAADARERRGDEVDHVRAEERGGAGGAGGGAADLADAQAEDLDGAALEPHLPRERRRGEREKRLARRVPSAAAARRCRPATRR